MCYLIYIIITMLRILVFVVFTFRNISWCLDIEISSEQLTWNELSTTNTTLLSKEYFAKIGWNILKTRLQENELYWIGARGNYTRFVSWEGCIERYNTSEECNLFKYEDSGSISKCIDTCTNNFKHFALQGDYCFCLTEEHRIYCLKNSSKGCGNPCLENPHDFCGGYDSVMTLYSKPKPDKVIYDVQNDSENNCLVLLYKNQTFTYQQDSCLTQGRRYVCTGLNGTDAVDYGSIITWQQAFDACRLKAENLYYKLPNRGEYGNSMHFWTSLRRSFHLNWTTNTSGPRKCVAVTKSNTSTLAVRLENCKKKLRYFYLKEHEDDSFKEKEKSNSNTMIITILIIACIALSVVTGGLCFFRHQAKRKANAQTQPVCRVVNNPQRQTETPARPFNPPFYNILEPCSGREPETSAGAHDVTTRPKQIYHTFAAVAQEEYTVYDSTSTSRNWNKRKQTRDGTIYGMRSADSCYDSVRHGNTAKREITPEIPNYYELAEF